MVCVSDRVIRSGFAYSHGGVPIFTEKSMLIP